MSDDEREQLNAYRHAKEQYERDRALEIGRLLLAEYEASRLWAKFIGQLNL